MFQSLCIYTDYILYYCIREILVHLLCICVKNQFMLGKFFFFFFFSVCDVFCDTMCIYILLLYVNWEISEGSGLVHETKLALEMRKKGMKMHLDVFEMFTSA